MEMVCYYHLTLSKGENRTNEGGKTGLINKIKIMHDLKGAERNTTRSHSG